MKKTRLFAVACLAAGAAAAAPAAAAPAGDTYEIKTADASTTSGGKGSAGLTILGKNGWHINKQAPVFVTLAPQEGLALEKMKLSRADAATFTDEKAVFDIPVQATTEGHGRRTIQADARFVMCQATACQIARQQVTLNVDIAPPAKKK